SVQVAVHEEGAGSDQMIDTRAEEGIGAVMRTHGMRIDTHERLLPKSTTLSGVAQKLAERMIGIFLPDAEGYRPLYGKRGTVAAERFAHDPHWKHLVLFFEWRMRIWFRGLAGSRWAAGALGSSTSFFGALKSEMQNAERRMKNLERATREAPHQFSILNSQFCVLRSAFRFLVARAQVAEGISPQPTARPRARVPACPPRCSAALVPDLCHTSPLTEVLCVHAHGSYSSRWFPPSHSSPRSNRRSPWPAFVSLRTVLAPTAASCTSSMSSPAPRSALASLRPTGPGSSTSTITPAASTRSPTTRERASSKKAASDPSRRSVKIAAPRSSRSKRAAGPRWALRPSTCRAPSP